MEKKAETSSEAHELELLERVFLRLGVAETDEQLEKALGRFLTPVILKLTSQHKPVQNKVLELLTHVNRRLKSRPGVRVPMDALLSLFTDTQAPPQVVNFSLVYVRLGFPRLSPSEQASLLPTLLHCLQGRTTQQQESLLQLCVPALVHLSLPRELSERRSLLGLEGREAVRTPLLNCLLYYLLLPYSAIDLQSAAVQPPLGLSLAQVAMATGGNFPEPDQLEKVKLSILRLLSSEMFTAEEILCHLLVAAGDPWHSVSDQGDHLLKQFSSDVDWNSPRLIAAVFHLYQGTVATPGKRPQSVPPSSSRHRQAPVSLRVRLRIMPYLLKSTYATNCFPACVQVVFDSLFGALTNTKLRTQTLHFVHHICSSAIDQKLAVMAPVILTGLNKIVDQPAEETKLQVLAYVGIGSLAKRVPLLFRKDTKHLLKLFETLKKELPQDVTLAVQECLSLMVAAYRGVEGQPALIVEALMLENVHSPSSQARLAAVQYASSVFPFCHVPSRFVCMLACGDSKDEVREEGRRGLRQPTREDSEDAKSLALPEFNKMVQYFHKRASLYLQSGQGYSTAAGTLPFPPPTLTEALQFLRACLTHSAGATEEQKLTNQTLAPIAKYLLRLASEKDGQSLEKYLDLLKQALAPAGDAELHSVAMEGLLEAVTASPPHLPFPLSLSKDILWIRGFTHSSRPETREPAGRLLGIMSGQLAEGEFLSLGEQILRDTHSESYHVQHGAVVSLGYVVSNCLRQEEGSCHGDVPMETTSPEKTDLVRRALERLIELLSSGPVLQLVISACEAVGEITRSGPLPLPEGGEEGEEALSKVAIVECLATRLRRASEVKLKERCALSLGWIVVGEPWFRHKQAILKGLFQVREEKAVELQFTVGEAISCATAGPISSVSHDPWRLPSNQQQSVVADADIMPWALETILTEYAFHSAPLVRRAASIWLLSLLKHAGTHPHIQGFLKRIQTAFMNMLAESNEVTQEAASRGLGMVYELSESSEKEELVGMLVGTLMEGRRSGGQVTGDTKLFQEGVLGKTPGGGSLSTYKEMCSLASDLNRPDLVYKFMHLANHHSLWNSKQGAAFGFSTIASQAQEQLAPYLPSLVPRLYRYKYDPSPRIQLAMSSIWSAVIPESKKAVDRYLPEILSDLESHLNSPVWRSREAACLALADLLTGRQAGEVAHCLPQFWELCLRARDDIKESVRKAADAACMALHKVTVRACDSSTMDKTGSQVVEAVLPLLLHKGMANPSAEVRAISLVSILKISENAGSLLKPHIALLVPSLLESLSLLEPQTLNTLSLRLSGEAEVQEKLEDIRVAASRSSPMMETVKLCLPHTDSGVLAALVPKVVEILKTGVGLGTKVSTAQFVVSLVHQCLHDLTPYAGKLLGALISGLSDRSVAVRKAYAKAIGHLVKVSKESSVSKMVEKLKNWYFEKDDPNIKSSIAHVYYAIAVHSLDTAKAMASEFLPLVFLAMHAKPREEDPSSEESLRLWKEAWQEVVPGTESGVQLYLGELVGVTCPALSAQSWHIKAQGAAAMATIAEKVGLKLGPPHLTTILTSLIDALQGRTWEGKESLLKALRSVSVSCKSALLNPQDPQQPTAEKVTQALLQQCKKQNPIYKAVAIATTGEVVGTLEVDVFSELSEILLPILDPARKSGSDSEGEEDRRASADIKLELQAKAFQALGQAWPESSHTQSSYYGRVCQTLSAALPVNTWKAQVAILSALCDIFTRLAVEISQEEVELLASLTIPAVCKCLGNVKYSAVRTKALQSVDKITSYLQGVGKLTGLPEAAISQLRTSLSGTALRDHQLRGLAQSVAKRLPSSSI